MRNDDRQRLQSSADQFEFGNEVDPDSNYILDALLDLEAMIDEEKKQKQQLEKRFDDIRAEKRGMPPLKPARQQGSGGGTKNNMESIAEEILELVQKRNELADAENIFLNKKPPTTSALADLQAQQDIRTQLRNQFAANNQNDGVPPEKRNSRKLLNTDTLQDMLKQADKGDTGGGSVTDNSDDEDESQQKPKVTRNMKFLQRIQEFEEMKNKKIEMMREQLKQKEEAEISQTVLNKPQISEKSATLALKVREKKSNSKKPLYKRVHEVVDERKQELKHLIKQYEVERDERFQSECTFQPKISEFDHDSDDEHFHTATEDSRRPHSRTPNRAAIGSFLDKQQDYELKSKIHQMNLKEYYDKVELQEVKRKPKISVASKKMVEGTRGYKPITEKLYELGKDRPKKLEEFRSDYIRELYPFQPNIKRVEPSHLKSTSKSPIGRELGMSAVLALDKLESLITEPPYGLHTPNQKRPHFQELHVGFADENDKNRANRSMTPVKSILKSPMRKDQIKKGLSPKTQKKVYFGQRPQKVPKDAQPRTSYRDLDGYVNIIFDKLAIEDLKKSLRFKN